MEACGDLRVALRPNAKVARNGGMFFAETTKSVREYVQQADAAVGQEVVFSTARDDTYRALRRDFDIPPLLAEMSMYPLVSIGAAGSGLAFHQHVRGWPGRAQPPAFAAVCGGGRRPRRCAFLSPASKWSAEGRRAPTRDCGAGAT